MAATNQQDSSPVPSATTSHTNNLTSVQQQELIKILAQHFHQQFYQMTSDNCTLNGSQFLNLTLNNTSTDNHNGTIRPAQSNLTQYHQQQPNLQGAFDSLQNGTINANNLSSGQNEINLHHHQHAQQQQQHFLPNNTSNNTVLRSHAQHQASNIQHSLTDPISMAAPSFVGPSEPFSDFSVLQQSNTRVGGGGRSGGGSHPFLNDINLFNALGFNLTNNQFVLSLQQQSLLQAAAAAKQYEAAAAAAASATTAGGNIDISREHHQRNQQQQQQQKIRHHQQRNSKNAATTRANNSLARSQEVDNQGDSKELLKFSITTILGRGSPACSNASPGGGDDCEQLSVDEQRDFNRLSQMKDFRLDKTTSRAGTDDAYECQEQVMAEFSGNESLSPMSEGAHPMPRTSSSMLFNHQLPPSVVNTDRHSHLHQHHHLNRHHQNPTHNGANFDSVGLLTAVNNHIQQQQLQQQQSPPTRRQQQSQHLTSQAPPLPSASQEQLTQLSHPQQPISVLTGATSFPWTVAARGKPRRGMMRRAVFSDSQRVGLEKRFQLQKYISKPDRKRLAEKLGLRDSQVKIWFQNRRMKWRNSKERELLSAGGSREQTLPTRNNPNPDLSDVGETVKRLTTNVSGSSSNNSIGK